MEPLAVKGGIFMNNYRSEYGFAQLAFAFAVGSIVGTTMGILFAPRAGRETREKFMTEVEDLNRKLQDASEKLRFRIDEMTAQKRERCTSARSETEPGSVERKEVFPGEGI